MIPDNYVRSTSERLLLYKELDESKSEQDLISFEEKLKDRFGPIPEQVLELIDTLRLRWLCVDLGFEKQGEKCLNTPLENRKLRNKLVGKRKGHVSPFIVRRIAIRLGSPDLIALSSTYS